MHQSQFLRDQRSRYLYRLGRLHQLADVTGIEPTQLAALLHRLQVSNNRKDITQLASSPKYTDTNTGVNTP